MAARRRRRPADHARVHARSRARPDGLQHAPGVRRGGRASRGVGVPPAASRCEPALRGLVALRCHALHRQDRHALGRRPRHGPARQHEHDGRCARADAQDASAVRRARAPRGRAAAVARAARQDSRLRAPALRGRGVLRRSRRLERARRSFGSRSSRDGGRRRRRARQQHHALRLSDGRQMGRPARNRRRGATRAQCVPQIRAARPRRVLLPDVLDRRCDAHQYGRSRQSDQTHLRNLSRHAHDGHGHGQRLDGSRDHEPSLGARAAREPVGREAARAAAVQDHVPRRSAAASVSRAR